MYDVSTLFYSNMIKYTRLNELILFSYQGSEATEINLFIDLYPIVRSLYRHPDSYILSNKYEFVNGMLAMISHYRSFFKGIDVYPRIYFIYSINCPEMNRKICAGYNDEMVQALTNEFNLKTKQYLNDNINFASQIFKFIPNTNYLISTTFESGVIINRIIHEDPDTIKCPNIIISKDIYLMQLVANDINTVILKPSKYKGEDRSIAISSKDSKSFWDIFCNLRHIKHFDFPLSCTSINTINSLCRVPERCLGGNYSIGTVVKQLLNNNVSEDIVYQNRKNAIDLEFQLSVYNTSAEYYLFDTFMNKIYDPEKFKKYLDSQKINIDPSTI